MASDRPTVFGYLFLIAGLVGLAGGIESLIRYVARCRRAVRVEAVVQKLRIDSSVGEEDESYTSAYPTVTFVANRVRIRTELSGYFPLGRVRRGQTILIYYDPRDPKDAVMRLRDWPSQFIATILSAVSAAVGATVLWA